MRGRFCVYCGQPITRGVACSQHSDLVAIDNAYQARGPALTERELGLSSTYPLTASRRVGKRRR